jgi:hypothetical protein
MFQWIENNRKVSIGLLITIIGVVITLVLKDIPQHLLDLLQTVFGAFVLGNAAEHAAAAYSSKDETTPPDLGLITDKLHTIEQSVATNQEALTTIVKIATGQK